MFILCIIYEIVGSKYFCKNMAFPLSMFDPISMDNSKGDLPPQHLLNENKYFIFNINIASNAPKANVFIICKNHVID